MKISDTSVYEKRNLGVDTCSILIEAGDDPGEVLKAIRSLKVPYQECKIPVKCVPLMWELEKAGFRFVETSFEFRAKTKDILLPKEFMAFDGGIAYREASEEDLEHIFEVIMRGNVYTTDKIALNPEYGKLIASKRYVNWIKDVLQFQNGHVAIISKQDVDVFVQVYKVTGDRMDMILGNTMVNNLGAGAIGYIGKYRLIQDLGVKEIRTHVSSNNLQSMRMMEQFGMKATGAEYVMIRMCDE